MRKRVVGRHQRGSGLVLWGAACALVFSGFLIGTTTVEAEEPPSAESVTEESEPCPYLVQARYPFLQCEKDAWGSVVFDAPVQEITGLRMPEMDSFIEGPGYWGS